MTDLQNEALPQFTGVWQLLSSEFRSSTGKVLYPIGEDASGLAIFTDSGYMSAQLMRQDRPTFAGGDQSSGTDEELRAALQGYVAYYGPCEVDVEQGTLSTHVEGSLFPNWVGGTQVRFYELSGDQLTLKTPPIAFGDDELTGVLKWKRYQP